MNFIKNLQKKFGRYGGIPNLMLYIIGATLVVFFMPMFAGSNVIGMLTLNRDAILSGQVWRLITFIFVPMDSGSIFSLFLTLYMLYWIGDSLERYWGSGAFTFYYLCGLVATIIAAMISGWGTASYLHLSLFLAYAYLFPEMQVMLGFVIPVRVKYLAYAVWAMYAFSLLVVDWQLKIVLLASILNFLLFFGEDFIGDLKNYFKYSKMRQNWRKNMNQNRNGW